MRPHLHVRNLYRRNHPLLDKSMSPESSFRATHPATVAFLANRINADVLR